MAVTKTILLANELRAESKPDAAARNDRKLFVANLGTLLLQTRDGILGTYLDNTELVHIVYRNGCEKVVNVRGASYLEIVQEVSKAL